MPKNSKTTILVAAAQHKSLEWLKRYAGPEIAGTVTAMIGAWTIHAATGSLVAAAIAASLSETIGFYGYAGWREAARHYRRHHRHPPLKRYVLTAAHTIRDMLVEFGPGELFDSLFARPFLMYIFPHLLHKFALGILVGKIAADIIFYASAILFYELKKKYLYVQEEN